MRAYVHVSMGVATEMLLLHTRTPKAAMKWPQEQHAARFVLGYSSASTSFRSLPFFIRTQTLCNKYQGPPGDALRVCFFLGLVYVSAITWSPNILELRHNGTKFPSSDSKKSNPIPACILTAERVKASSLQFIFLFLQNDH